MGPVQRVLSNQTAVSVTQLEMKLMLFIRQHLENANVSIIFIWTIDLGQCGIIYYSSFLQEQLC